MYHIIGRFPERPKGADCKSVVTDFGGSNPPSPTNLPALVGRFFFLKKRTFTIGVGYGFVFVFCNRQHWA